MKVSGSQAYQEYKTFRRNQRGLARGYHQGNFFRVYDDKPDVLVALSRRVGLHNSRDLQTEVMNYIKRYAGDITLDLRDLIEPDSAIVAILTLALASEKRNGRQMRVTNAQKRLVDLVKMQRLSSLARCFIL